MKAVHGCIFGKDDAINFPILVPFDVPKVQQYTERDRFLSVSEALEFGLIDGILETEY
ncbi:putative endopeptidase Clp [Helianthus debilis subsp. tardiflorus]